VSLPKNKHGVAGASSVRLDAGKRSYLLTLTENKANLELKGDMTTTPKIEEVRAYWDSRPCNLRHSNALVGTRQYFDEVEARKYFVESHIPEFADFEAWRGKRVLEVGCGIGTDAVNFARHGANYTGIELSKLSLELARERFQVYELEGRFMEVDTELIEDSPLQGETFDLIYSFGVLHHTPNPERALRALRGLCHDSTELRIMLYAKRSWKAAMIAAGLDQPEAQNGCPIALTFTEGEAVTLLADAGFAIAEVSQDHVFPYQVDPYRNYEYVREPWFDSMPTQVFQALEMHLGWHLLISAHPTSKN